MLSWKKNNTKLEKDNTKLEKNDAKLRDNTKLRKYVGKK